MSEAVNVAALKQKIIEAGISGKLVPQIASEGTAEELLKQIDAERAALIKAGKIKKEKPLPEITEEEIPFEIPMSWKWVRFGKLYSLSNGVASRGTPSGIERQVLRLADLSANKINYGNIRKISLDDSEYNSHIVKKGDLVFIRVNGTKDKVGRAFLYSENSEVSYCDHLFCGHKVSRCIFSEYIKMYFNSVFSRKTLFPLIKTTAGQNTISQKDMAQIPIPLPPLSEQKRIVAKIEELMTEIDYIECLQSAYTANQNALKKKIIEAGITGKLVPQIASEGTAKELLKQIETERSALIKEGKIKKEKPLPQITEDDIPFEIPKSWKWVRLANIVFNNGQKIPNKRFSYIDIGSIDNVHNKLNTKEQIIEANNAPTRARKIVTKGDIIYATVRPYLHNACIIDKEFIEEPIASTGFAVLSCYPSISNKYLFSYLLSSEFDSYANSSENATGTMYPAITEKKLYAGLVPLPPLSEQKRIVAKIDELMRIIDRLEV